MASVIAVLDLSLRAFGAVGAVLAGYAYYRYQTAMKSHCDFPCAKAKMPPDAWKGKVAWITGASSGIGKELAIQMARQGAKLILSARRADVLESIAEDLRNKGAEVKVLVVDLADLESLEGKAKEALKLFDGIDVLVNNGGYSSRALAKDTPGIKEEQAMMNVNFLSCCALAKAVAPCMREKKQGWIINISSLSGKVGVPLRTLYCGAKHALIGWFDAFRAEEEGFWQSGIKVINVCPGSTKTDVAKNAVTADGSKMGHSDPTIDGGLDVEFVCDRTLAAAYNGLEEVWIARVPELQAPYMGTLLPTTFKSFAKSNARGLVARTMGEEFVKTRLS